MATSALSCTRKGDWRKTGEPPDGYTIAPPDGKWGWVVLFGCCLSGLTCMVNNIVFGVTMKYVANSLKINLATITWALSISSGGGSVFGPLVTILINNYSCRRSVIIGGLMCSIGLVLTTFIDRIELLLVTFGILTGIGRRLVFAPLHVCLSLYFKKYLGIAVGFLMASFAASKFIMTPVVQLVLENYGWRGTYLILGGFMLHVCLGASLLQPVRWHTMLVPIHSDTENVEEVPLKGPRIEIDSCQDSSDVANDGSINSELPVTKFSQNDLPNVDSRQQLLNDSHQCHLNPATNLSKCIRDGRRPSELSVNLASSYDIFTPFAQESARNNKVTTVTRGCLASCKNLILESIDCNLLKEKLFYMICISHALATAVNIYLSIFVFHFGTEIGLPPMQAAGLESARALGEITGRLAGPILLITVLKLSTRFTYLSCVFLHAIGLFALTNLEGFVSLCGVSVVIGLILGAAVGLHGLLMIEQMGVKRLSSVLGLCALFQGLFLILVGPFIGWIRDTSDRYKYCLLFLALLQLLSALIWILKPCIIRTANKSKNSYNSSNNINNNNNNNHSNKNNNNNKEVMR